MKIKKWDKYPHVKVNAGDYFVTNEEIILTTLLGSCVSACLYDPYNGISAMNHFMLSNKRYSRNMPICISEAGRYGVNSMELMINEMWKCGARRGNLKAKVFGGAAVLTNKNSFTSNFFAVGEVNIRFIREFLETEKIALVSSDLGGTVGRVIYFNSADYSVYVRKIARRDSDLVKREEKFWNNSIQKQEKTETQIDLW